MQCTHTQTHTDTLTHTHTQGRGAPGQLRVAVHRNCVGPRADRARFGDSVDAASSSARTGLREVAATMPGLPLADRSAALGCVGAAS